MTRYLISEANPKGSNLEEILLEIRKDIILRCTKIVDGTRNEAHFVLNNNVKILGLLSEAIVLAEDSTQILDKGLRAQHRRRGRSAQDRGGLNRRPDPVLAI